MMDIYEQWEATAKQLIFEAYTAGKTGKEIDFAARYRQILNSEDLTSGARAIIAKLTD